MIASEISGIPLAIRSELEGLLVPEGDAEELLAALRRVLSSADERARMGRAGRRRVELELTWDNIAERYREGYDAALAL